MPALFLERFGVLLTLNAVARNPLDALPPDEAADRQVARRLAAQAQLNFNFAPDQPAAR
jgi:hypothetical protein